MNTQVHSRLAGSLYLIIILCGLFAEIGVRLNLIAYNDANLTAHNILEHTGLFRLGFAADAIMLLCDIAIAVVLYQLLGSKAKTLTIMATVFRLIQAGMISVSLLCFYGAFLLITQTIELPALEADLRNNYALFLLNMHSYGYDFGLLFFAITNMALGRIFIRYTSSTKLLGWALIAAATTYFMGSSIRFLTPDYSETFQPFYIIALAAELYFCFWLLFQKNGFRRSLI